MTRTQRISSVFVIGIAAALIAFTGSFAHADEKLGIHLKGDLKGDIRDAVKSNLFAKSHATATSTASVTISNDNVTVHGAKVTATSTAGFTATSGAFTFTVTTDANTKFENKGSGKGSLAGVAVGDSVNFRGVAISSATNANISVRATNVEDKTAHPVVKPVKPAKPVATSTVNARVEARITVLNQFIAQLQALIARLQLQIH